MKLSPTQQEAINQLKDHGKKIVRLQGGYWTYPDCPKGTLIDGKAYGDYPRWSIDIRTVRVLEKAGHLRRCKVFPEEWRDSRELVE